MKNISPLNPIVDSTEPYWTTRDGRKIPISEMTTEHLQNTIAMLKRKGFVGRKKHNFYESNSTPLGEMAQLAFEQEELDILSRPVSAQLDYLVQELEKRDKSK